MSIFKPFLTSDTIVSPFKVNKSFTFQGNELTSSNVEIDRYIGVNITSSLFISGSYPTGFINIQDQTLIYRSIKELYYSNYIFGSNGSPANTDFLKKVGIDNSVTLPADSAQKILEELINIGFAFTSLYAMGCGYPNQKERPIFCFRTTHPQHPHVDSINSTQSIALALYAINADGVVKTYVADIEKILYFLTAEEIDLLRQKVFYIPSDNDSDYGNKKDLFSILEFKSNGEPFVRFDGKPAAIHIDDSVDRSTALEMIEVIDKINVVVERLLETGQIESIGLKTGEFLFNRNRLTLHGRQDEKNKFGDDDTIFLADPSLLTPAGNKRMVSRILSGAPSIKEASTTPLNSTQTEPQIR